MEAQEYYGKIDELEQEFQKAKNKLAREYAISNNAVTVGDIITDNTSSIKVDQIKYTLGSTNELPCCAYFGYELKKDLTPRKDKSRRAIYQSAYHTVIKP